MNEPELSAWIQLKGFLLDKHFKNTHQFDKSYFDMDDAASGDDAKRKQFGNRFLNDEKNVFQHNAWYL